MALHIDIETYSSVSLPECGVYKYVESPDFEIMLFAYSLNGSKIKIVDLAQGEKIPEEVEAAMTDPGVTKYAHNANFERQCLRKFGYDIPPDQWICTAVFASYCGLPMSLGQITKAVDLGKNGKMKSGKALIKYFCVPCRSTRTNDQRNRNLPKHAPGKWSEFKRYCIGDVAAEMQLCKLLGAYELPAQERRYYETDQIINDRGVLVDLDFAKQQIKINETRSANLMRQIKKITGLDNSNSPKQLKGWLSEKLGFEVESLNKEVMPGLLEEAADYPEVEKALQLRNKLSKTSISKYVAMVNYASDIDQRVRGMFQFYGTRTARWAGRGVQVQNLPQNKLKDLDGVRQIFQRGDYEEIIMLFDNVSSCQSQLIRTAFVAPPGYTFVVADYSAIEARVIAWLAGEQWRLDVFKGDGKIYEASASVAFGIPIEDCQKESDNNWRAIGKVLELAAGYGGSVGAMKKFGADRLGLTDEEMSDQIKVWRQSSPNIVQLWKRLEAMAMQAIRKRRPQSTKCGRIKMDFDGKMLRVHLPSGRHISYWNAQIYEKSTQSKHGLWTRPAIRYKGMDQQTGQWVWLDTYGGKLTENVIQALARDLLAHGLENLRRSKIDTVMHIHDEAVCQIRYPSYPSSELGHWLEDRLNTVCELLTDSPDWADGLPLTADGYITDYYKKD